MVRCRLLAGRQGEAGQGSNEAMAFRDNVGLHVFHASVNAFWRDRSELPVQRYVLE